MRAMAYRLITFLAAVLIALSLTAQPPIENPNDDPTSGGGGGSCRVCAGVIHQDGSFEAFCASPAPNHYGSKYCDIYTYPEATYCSSYGDLCCVD
jgi:hypothetical protein